MLTSQRPGERLEFCFSGNAAAENAPYTAWGAGVGFDVCAMPADMSFLPASLQSLAVPILE